MYIDKLAFLFLKEKRLLVTRSKGKDRWYIPGGKREPGESDQQCLIREITEELSVALSPASLQPYGIFEAQAHGKPPGTMVRMTCYTGIFTGNLAPSAEIEEIAFFTYADKDKCSEVDHLIFDDLHGRGVLD